MRGVLGALAALGCAFGRRTGRPVPRGPEEGRAPGAPRLPTQGRFTPGRERCKPSAVRGTYRCEARGTGRGARDLRVRGARCRRGVRARGSGCRARDARVRVQGAGCGRGMRDARVRRRARGAGRAGPGAERGVQDARVRGARCGRGVLDARVRRRARGVPGERGRAGRRGYWPRAGSRVAPGVPSRQPPLVSSEQSNWADRGARSSWTLQVPRPALPSAGLPDRTAAWTLMRTRVPSGERAREGGSP